MSMPLEEAADILNTSAENLAQEGLKAYLREKLRETMAEITSICLKFKVSSLEELDAKVSAGKLDESDTFEDLTRLDYLESKAERIKGLIEKLP
ncbi:MAG: hypothetical protein D9V47_02055 [Clostridia bacterium]|nr:MAG: hypothetical protein D9V47_02055 [Clostridia bacterium]